MIGYCRICWFTNLDMEKRHKELTLFKRYTPAEYPKYDNYDAIEVGKTTGAIRCSAPTATAARATPSQTLV